MKNIQLREFHSNFKARGLISVIESLQELHIIKSLSQYALDAVCLRF